MLYFLVHSYWQQHLSFKNEYLPLSFVITYLTLEVAIILILKNAASLCLSGISATSALTQAESAFQKANIMSKIEDHFTASYQEYTLKQFVEFLLNTDIGL